MDNQDGYFDEPAAARYDELSADMFQPAAVDPVVEVLARLAGGGRALELGIGTGRIACPGRCDGDRPTASPSRLQQRVVVRRALVEAGQHRPRPGRDIGSLVIFAGEGSNLLQGVEQQDGGELHLIVEAAP